MKYFLLFLSLFVFGLTGCNQKEPSEIVIETKIENKIPLQSMYTGGDFTGTFYIDGLQGPIIISGKKLIYENIFSINVPTKHITNRTYDKIIPNNYINQNISFSENDHSKSFYITALDTNFLEKPIDNKGVCLLQTTYNGSPTFAKNTTHKIINDYDIFITQITFFTEGNIPPYDYTYITHFCFIKDTIMYDVVFDNYPFIQANQLINSFTFLD